MYVRSRYPYVVQIRSGQDSIFMLLSLATPGILTYRKSPLTLAGKGSWGYWPSHSHFMNVLETFLKLRQVLWDFQRNTDIFCNLQCQQADLLFSKVGKGGESYRECLMTLNYPRTLNFSLCHTLFLIACTHSQMRMWKHATFSMEKSKPYNISLK